MNTLWFGIIWTALAIVGVIYIRQNVEYSEQALIFQIVMILMPLAGLFVIWDGLRKVRRFRSVRREETSEGLVYIWNELDGSEMRSSKDPRPDWDKEDRNFAD